MDLKLGQATGVVMTPSIGIIMPRLKLKIMTMSMEFSTLLLMIMLSTSTVSKLDTLLKITIITTWKLKMIKATKIHIILQFQKEESVKHGLELLFILLECIKNLPVDAQWTPMVLCISTHLQDLIFMLHMSVHTILLVCG